MSWEIIYSNIFLIPRALYKTAWALCCYYIRRHRNEKLGRFRHLARSRYYFSLMHGVLNQFWWSWHIQGAQSTATTRWCFKSQGSTAPSAGHSALISSAFLSGISDLLHTTGCFWRYHWSLSTAPYSGDMLPITAQGCSLPGFCARGQNQRPEQWERTPIPVKPLPAKLSCAHLLCIMVPVPASTKSSCPGKPPRNQGSADSLLHLHACVQSRALLKSQVNGSCRDSLLLGEIYSG